MTTLSNTHLGLNEKGFDVIDVEIYGLTDILPIPEQVAGLVMRVDRPKPHEVKRVEVISHRRWTVYRLFVKKDPCPVRWVGICPLCRKEH